MNLMFPIDLKTYQKTLIQSFFNLGLTFSVDGEQLKVDGFNQFSPDDRLVLAESIRRNKKEIMKEVKLLQDRLSELIKTADHSRGMMPDQIQGISEEGCQIMDHLPDTMIQQIFK